MTENIENIIKRSFKISGDLDPEGTMETVMGWDSMSHMELIVSLENELGIQFTGDEIADMQSIQSIQSLTLDKLSGN